MAGVFNKFVHPGTVKQGYLVKSPPLDKKLKLDVSKHAMNSHHEMLCS